MIILYIHGSYSGIQDPSTLQVLYMCDAFSQIEDVEIKLAFSLPKHHKKKYLNIIEEKIGRDINFEIITYKTYTVLKKMSALGGYFGINRIIRNEDFDIIYTRLPIALIIASKNSKKVIYESHNYIMHNTINYLNKYFQKKLIKLSKKGEFLKLITISNNLKKKWISEGIASKKIIVLHDAISKKDFTINKDRFSARKEIQLPNEKKIVVYVGSVDNKRGIAKIIKLASCFKDTLFIVVGGSEYQKNKFQNFANSNKINNVIFKGFVIHKKVFSYLYSADILLMTFDRKLGTLDYCSPIKMFEYMAAGRIIVGQNFPTISEVLTNNKDSFLADPDSFDELRSSLNKALCLEYPNIIAKNAQKKVFKYYTWAKRAETVLSHI